jgi:flavin reductase (DIM6/NTAB) family NADH-FMN oxidoreductase RutF
MRIDPATLSPGRRYYLMTSAIVPRPIAWIGTLNEDGGYNLAPFSFFNGFSGTPPLIGVGFSAHEDKGQKDTLRNIRRTGELTISIPTLQQAEQVQACAQNLPYGDSEFSVAGVTPAPAELISAPRVAEAKVSFECTLWQLIPLGNGGSTLMLAEIRLFHILDTLLDDYGCVDGHRFKALARMSAGRYAPVGDIFKTENQQGRLGD